MPYKRVAAEEEQRSPLGEKTGPFPRTWSSNPHGRCWDCQGRDDGVPVHGCLHDNQVHRVRPVSGRRREWMYGRVGEGRDLLRRKESKEDEDWRVTLQAQEIVG